MESNSITLQKNSCFIITASAIVTILVALSSFINSLFNFNLLTNFPSFWFNISISSAVCFVFSGLVLLFIASKNRGFITDVISYTLTIFILLISGLSNPLMLKVIGLFNQNPFNAGQMALTVAIAFLLVGASFVLILKKSKSIWLIQIFTWFIILITLISAFNYLYGADPASAFARYTTMSMQSMFLFILISISILLTNIKSGIVGTILRRNRTFLLMLWVIPISIVIPALLIQIGFLLENSRLIDPVGMRVLRHTTLFAIIGIMVALIAIILNRKEKELKTAQSEIIQNELIFHQFAENIEIVFYTNTPDLNKVLYVSPAYEKIWGKTSESLYKNPNDWFDAIIPEDKKMAYEAFFVGMQQGKEKASAEFRIKRPDGAVKNIFSRIYQVKDELNQVFAIVGIAIDMTQITLEKRYKQIQHDLLNDKATFLL
ncbi:PAS domain-containing protein [Legionella yabuuchiae]|uniref:PAS domain-containing protein n=1 Tax=Legionella yabuuchiae TaxID=376727 RepID=UPI001055B132|nr:PAS domain-containing protein [Legionella yabuuchiae]